MATTAFDPFREFERFITGFGGNTSQATALPMDLYKKGDTFVAEIEMPGVEPDSIDIDVDDRTLTVRAERSTKKSDEVEWVSRERRSGAFARQLNLGRGLATDKISADYEDGVLTLTIPVAEEAKPRKIAVNHVLGSSSQDAVEASEEKSDD